MNARMKISSKMKISILSHSPYHNSRLSDQFSSHRLSWALDIDGLLKEVAVAQEASIAIVELRSQTLAKDCEKVFQLAICNASNAVFFAIGGEEIRPWLPLVRHCGFAGYFPPERLRELRIPIERQQRNRGYTEDSIEDQVFAGLPWTPTGE